MVGFAAFTPPIQNSKEDGATPVAKVLAVFLESVGKSAGNACDV
jgi:hypothetical protein